MGIFLHEGVLLYECMSLASRERGCPFAGLVAIRLISGTGPENGEPSETSPWSPENGCRTASNKLDVMSSEQFNLITGLNIVCVVYTFVHDIALAAACKTIWLVEVNTKGIHGEPMSAHSKKFNKKRTDVKSGHLRLLLSR